MDEPIETDTEGRTDDTDGQINRSRGRGMDRSIEAESEERTDGCTDQSDAYAECAAVRSESPWRRLRSRWRVNAAAVAAAAAGTVGRRLRMNWMLFWIKQSLQPVSIGFSICLVRTCL